MHDLTYLILHFIKTFYTSLPIFTISCYLPKYSVYGYDCYLNQYESLLLKGVFCVWLESAHWFKR